MYYELELSDMSDISSTYLITELLSRGYTVIDGTKEVKEARKGDVTYSNDIDLDTDTVLSDIDTSDLVYELKNRWDFDWDEHADEMSESAIRYAYASYMPYDASNGVKNIVLCIGENDHSYKIREKLCKFLGCGNIVSDDALLELIREKISI